MTKTSNNSYQIQVSLIGAQPPIWRRLLIEPDTTFQDLHRIIQLAMGWQFSHLHLFQAQDGRLLGDLAEDEDSMLNVEDESAVAVSSLLAREGQALMYEYDFGDGWEHDVKLEKILPVDQAEPLPCLPNTRMTNRRWQPSTSAALAQIRCMNSCKIPSIAPQYSNLCSMQKP